MFLGTFPGSMLIWGSTLIRKSRAVVLKWEVQTSVVKLTLDFLISVDPQLGIDPGKVPRNNKRRPPNKHRPWKILTNCSPSNRSRL